MYLKFAKREICIKSMNKIYVYKKYKGLSINLLVSKENGTFVNVYWVFKIIFFIFR